MTNTTKKFSFLDYVGIASMLFGLFFGAGNLIFPIFLGKQAGSLVSISILGFLVSSVGFPLLGVIAIAMTRSNGLFDLTSKVHPAYAYFVTILLYLTIGPLFVVPRLATVSYEVGLSQVFDSPSPLYLMLFTIIFFVLVLIFSLKPGNILDIVGKFLNPLFLFFLSFLIIASFVFPMSSLDQAIPTPVYASTPFLKGFLDGYNTVDALAALAFGIIVVNTVKAKGVTHPKDVSSHVIKSGALAVVVMGIIYVALAYIGAFTAPVYGDTQNGGQILSLVASHYFGRFGQVILFLTVALACLKTGIGLITAFSETFIDMFPNGPSYKTYVILTTSFSCVVANIGLTQLIQLSVPLLMFLYPLVIVLIFLSILSPLFNHAPSVFLLTSLFTLPVAIIDGLAQTPEHIQQMIGFVRFYDQAKETVPFLSVGMGWIIPSLIGFIFSFILYRIRQNRSVSP
ncbi:branched-chain amino acid transport system II carrier protein [Atopobacter phocae]|uniref:branched-chain amino acid transport system II carrier protein n=1 Tax=Atopobacter phocae TaxID=136492 RepID=UPI000471A1D9|nr:branched-chain amino acid transport system II carrier protein [Atopobacter phocae]